MLFIAGAASSAAAETLALKIALVEVGRDPVLQQPFITITLEPESRSAMGEFSRLRVGETVTIRLGDMVLSQPVVREPILEGALTIAGNMTREDAERMAREINAGTHTLFVDGSDK
jgi:preprotein translocase subunit SecD